MNSVQVLQFQGSLFHLAGTLSYLLKQLCNYDRTKYGSEIYSACSNSYKLWYQNLCSVLNSKTTLECFCSCVWFTCFLPYRLSYILLECLCRANSSWKDRLISPWDTEEKLFSFLSFLKLMWRQVQELCSNFPVLVCNFPLWQGLVSIYSWLTGGKLLPVVVVYIGAFVICFTYNVLVIYDLTASIRKVLLTLFFKEGILLTNY